MKGLGIMSVGDELSSDVAAALLEMEGPVDARDLKDVLVLLRSTLGALSTEEKLRRRARLLLVSPPGLPRSKSPDTN